MKHCPYMYTIRLLPSMLAKVLAATGMHHSRRCLACSFSSLAAFMQTKWHCRKHEQRAACLTKTMQASCARSLLQELPVVVTVNMKLLASTCSQAQPEPKTLAAASLNLHRQTGWCLRCSSAAQQMLNECAGTASCQAGCAGQQQLRDNCSSLTYFS